MAEKKNVLAFAAGRKNAAINNAGRKKALIFTLDAILAIILSLAMILGILGYLSKSEQTDYGSVELQKLSMDILTLLEKDLALMNKIDAPSSTTINVFLNNTDARYCGSIAIYDSANNITSTIKKTGCTDGTYPVFTRRVFIANQHIYLAELKSWWE